ncbi:DUF3140 domain-containing protein [Luteipulveratus flavus]|uniref:DUF3140 domain-containing protein n=1 Tax=Luteipulveratus flavus TaxID=3031728 RepID=A0ABT6CBP9_9MICO|nr:DUF3140 domain-containing protein [Luteipulveratus sp. YIM 133296]MDF8266332.1 DUF3140 domain-containing protein [Luteipulveratus sp. YIM 133296]
MAEVSDELWGEFHTVVNMTSAELEDWLRVEASQERSEGVPEQDEPHLGRQVVHILGKRRTDLTDEDARNMQTVVDRVRSQRRDDLEPTAGDTGWRHGLMRVGHDPLKPPGAPR